MQNLVDFKLPNNFRGKNFIIVQLWWFVSFFFFKNSPQFFYSWRNFLLRVFGGEIGKGVKIRPSAVITYPWNLKIGNYSWIGDDVRLYNLDKIIIGKNTVISQDTYLCTGSHDYKSENFEIIKKPLIIEDNVWIAARCFIHPGINIKKNCIISAFSNLKESTIENGIYFGSPAKFIKKRFN